MKYFRWSYIFVLILIGPVLLEDVNYHDWAVKVRGGEDTAKQIAKENGLTYIGKIGNLENIYHFRENVQPKRRWKRSIIDKTEQLNANDKVTWAEQQKDLVRHKRNIAVNYLKGNREQRAIDEETKMMFNDPEWINEWYLYDARSSRQLTKEDLHVIPVWKMNITGRGVTVTIVDDGLEYTHPDLRDNYDPQSSTDINGNDSDPFPNLAPGTSNEHGTRCASEISMVANNKICGVGIAYNAKIGGIRILDGKINDAVEARAIGFNNDHIDVYSASWGPSDDGKSMEKPGLLLQQALYQGVTKGRKGKGNLYVWATGNGGYYNDSCACDGYVSSMYVFSINSISPYSSAPKFIERCSSTMAATFSTSQGYKSKLVAADVHGKCTTAHSGTSASAPYAAGIFALALEANPNLTWRDFKHLLAWTSQFSPLHADIAWQKNAAGFWVHEYFGFGEMDATSLVKNALQWVTVPPMTSCVLIRNVSSKISNDVAISVIIDGTPCQPKVQFIEHLEIMMTFQYSYRGALHIVIRSPNGMNTTLLPARYLDSSREIMINWPFISVHNWGENPRGLWTIFAEDKRSDKKPRYGTIANVSLIFHGTKTMPHHIDVTPNKRRSYDVNYNHVRNERKDFNGRSR